MKSEIKDAIEKLGGNPYLWQIEQETQLKSNTLRAQLKNYPDHLNISLTEKSVLENYKPGMSFDQLAKSANMSQNTVRNIVVRLSKRGLVKFTTNKYDTSGDKNVYVHVITDKVFKIKLYGVKQATNVVLKGCGGYIIPANGKKTTCIIFKDTVPYRIKVEMSDIKIKEKHSFGRKL